MATKQTTPTEMTVEEKLKTLYDLQKVLSRIDEIRTIRGELPLEVQDLSDAIEGLSLRISKYREEMSQINTSIAKWKAERAQAQTVIERAQANLDSVANSREYDSLSKEIEYQQLEIQLRDKRINEGQAHYTHLEEEVDQFVTEREERERDLDQKKQELDDIISENKAEEDRLREQAKVLEEKIEPRLLMAFKRIRKNTHNGLGIVTVERDACGGCFAKIPPQRQLDVLMHKKIIVCEYCGRILIDPELAGIEQPKPQVEEKKKTRKRATSCTVKKTTEAK